MTQEEIIDYIEDRYEFLIGYAGQSKEDGLTNKLAIAMAYELERLKRRILNGRLTDRDIEGWLLIYAGTEQPVDEYLAKVMKQTGLDKEVLLKHMFRLVEEGRLYYGTDARVVAV